MFSRLFDVSDLRKKQWEYEHKFDNTTLGSIKDSCGPELVIEFLLIRSKIHRELSLDVYNSSLIEKLDAYKKYVKAINTFNETIDEKKSSCEELRKFLDMREGIIKINDFYNWK